MPPVMKLISSGWGSLACGLGPSRAAPMPAASPNMSSWGNPNSLAKTSMGKASANSRCRSTTSPRSSLDAMPSRRAAMIRAMLGRKLSIWRMVKSREISRRRRVCVGSHHHALENHFSRAPLDLVNHAAVDTQHACRYRLQSHYHPQQVDFPQPRGRQTR
ncbi:hypothetical protein [Sinorhizobium meliloti]|uniref:hypothetical protein n=1 Tax=Rhizobium meliloti TaxID=382 RepID=UPI0013E31127